MKLSISNSFWLMAIVFSFSIMSCGDAGTSTDGQESSEEIEDTMYLEENGREVTDARRTMLSEKIRNLEVELGNEINELDKKIETGTEAEKVKWQTRREKLAMEREQLKNDLDNMGDEISNDWEKLEEDIADRLDRISEDLRDDN